MMEWTGRRYSQQEKVDWEWLEGYQGDESSKGKWYELFGMLFSFGAKSKISPKNLKTLEIKIQEIGPEAFLESLAGFLNFFRNKTDWFKGKPSALPRAFIWAAALHPEERSIAFIQGLVELAYHKIGGKGPRSLKIANRGLQALVEINSEASLGALLKMKSKSNYPAFIKALNKNLDKVREVRSFDEEEILDRITPGFDLEDQGLEVHFGRYKAQVYISFYNKFHQEWLRLEDGKVQKSIPASVKQQEKALENYKALIKEIKQTLQSQRHRLENSWRTGRVWNYAHWKEYLLDHPLLRIITRSLIWQFEWDDQRLTALAPEGSFLTIGGGEPEIPETARVRLWHPSQAPVEESLAWRNFLFDKEIKQAFKQAFREIYLLTPAELESKFYSNRFSAHILDQRKLWALMSQRGWKYQGALGLDLASPELHLEAFQIDVRLEIAYPSDDYVSTQRVSFLDASNPEAIALEKLDPVLFSEAMRDIDLFIAVSSIGSDPNWTGSDDYRDYWMDYSFGEKSESSSARQRKEILERIIPKSKIGDKARIEGNFLVVQGKRRSYKINIGSSNILMEPEQSYLCIVPDRKKINLRNQIFLPFDEDSLLNLIISKAFLLVEDDKITDPLIISQINPD